MSNSNSKGTSFDYRRVSETEFKNISKVDSLKPVMGDTLSVTIFSEAKFHYDTKIIKAATQAIANTFPIQINISTVNKISEIPAEADFIFWLAEEPCTIKISTRIGFSRCSNPNLPLLIPGAKATYHCEAYNDSFDWIISKRLNEENALQESLSFTLAQILLKETNFAGQQQISFDKRSMSTDAAFSGKNENKSLAIENETLAETEPSLLILLLILLTLERFTAFKRNQ